MILRTGKGFTLIELIVVLGIILLIFALTPPFFKNSSKVSLRNDIGLSIESIIRNAREIATSRNEEITVNLGSNSVWISDKSGKQIGKKLIFPKHIIFSPTHIKQSIKFSPRGKVISGGATIYIEHVKIPGEYTKIEIKKSTGIPRLIKNAKS